MGPGHRKCGPSFRGVLTCFRGRPIQWLTPCSASECCVFKSRGDFTKCKDCVAFNIIPLCHGLCLNSNPWITRKASWPLAQRGAPISWNPGMVFCRNKIILNLISSFRPVDLDCCNLAILVFFSHYLAYSAWDPRWSRQPQQQHFTSESNLAHGGQSTRKRVLMPVLLRHHPAKESNLVRCNHPKHRRQLVLAGNCASL